MKMMKPKFIRSVFDKLVQPSSRLFLWGLVLAVLYFSFYLVKIVLLKNDQNNYPPNSSWAVAVFAGLVVVLLIVYYWSSRVFLEYPKLKLILFFSAVFSVILLFIQPFCSADLFHYILYPKIVLVYHHNPYITPLIDYSGDILFRLGSPIKMWLNSPLVYGPVWLLLSIVFTFWSLSSVGLALFSFKLMATIFFFGCLLLVYKILDHIGSRNKNLAVALFAWSPLILIESVNNGHNDIVMLFFLLLAFFCLVKEKYFWVLPIIILSILIKYVPIILAPFIFLYLWRRCQRDQKRILIWSVFFSLSLFVLFYLPFWHGWSTLHGAIFMSVEYNLKGLSILGYIIQPFYEWLKMDLFFSGLGPLGFISLICRLVFAYFYFYLLFKVRPNNINDLLKLCCWVVGLVFLTITFYLQPWYFVVPLGLMVLVDSWPKRWFILINLFAFLIYFFFVFELFFVFCLFFVLDLYFNWFLIKEIRRIKNVILVKK
ncbi:MAG: hypothetical protein WC480_01170 [Patescibacteria group bacterium]